MLLHDKAKQHKNNPNQINLEYKNTLKCSIAGFPKDLILQSLT